MVPFGGGVLMGVAVFWVSPEIAETLGWPAALTWIAAGFGLLWVIDRYVYPVCPACSHTHEHDKCVTTLHGFATPLLAAAALHSALDGWSAGFGGAFVWGVAFHKIPEGIALGVIARASLESRGAALLWCALAESSTLVGAGLEGLLAPHLNATNLHALLALAGGSFLYLGGHAVHGELRRSGPTPALVPAFAGMAGSSVLRLFIS
jgi:zinc and cadmium transporter